MKTKDNLGFEIKYIMSAKNFTEEQAENFLTDYKGYIKAENHISLDEFIEKTGGVSPIIDCEILSKTSND